MRAVIAATSLLLASTATAQQVDQNEEIIFTYPAEVYIRADEIIVRDVIENVDYLGSDKKIKPGAILLVPSEALNTVPGVHLQQGSGVESLTSIRSPVLTGGAGAGSFAYMLDGISLRAPGFGNVNGFLEMPFDLAQSLTIYKGPQTALFGGNAQHGAINAVSGSSDENHSSLTLGTDDYIAGKAVLGNERVNLGVSAIHDGGFRADSGYDVQKFILSAQDDIGLWTVRGVLTATNVNQETAGFAQGPDAYRDDAIAFGNANPEAFRDTRSFLAYVSAMRQYDSSRVSVKAYTRYADMDFRLHFLPGQALERNDHTSLGASVQYEHFGDVMHWGVTLSSELTQGHLDEVQDAPTRFSYIQGDHYDYDVSARNIDLSADFKYRVADNFDILGAARLSGVKYDYNNNVDSGVFGRFLRLDNKRDNFKLFSPQLTATYEFNSYLKAFAKIAHSERAPQTTDLYRVQLNQATNPADIETLDAIEAGLRGTTDNVQWGATVYIQRKENFFFRDADGFNVADGVTDHGGIELSARWDISKTWQASGNITLAENTYGFTNQVANSSEIITNGNDIDTAPRVTAYALVSYAPPHAPYALSLSAHYIGQYFTNAANTQDYPGHTVFTGGGRYALTDDAKILFRAENLLDTRYADRADFAFGNERYFPGRPRSLFVTLEKTF